MESRPVRAGRRRGSSARERRASTSPALEDTYSSAQKRAEGEGMGLWPTTLQEKTGRFDAGAEKHKGFCSLPNTPTIKKNKFDRVFALWCAGDRSDCRIGQSSGRSVALSL